MSSRQPHPSDPHQAMAGTARSPVSRETGQLDPGPAAERLAYSVDEAARLRAVEQACRTAIDRDTAYTPPEPARTLRSPELQPGRQIDLQAEP